MKREKSCGAVIFNNAADGRRVLLIRHVNGGHWAFPKGHVENDETEEQTATREILEETGLSVVPDTRFRYTVTYSPSENITKDVIYFAAFTDTADAVRQVEEVTEIRFVPIDKAEELITFENDKAVFRAAKEYIENKKD